MIRLIASDVDGTFCDGNSSYNKERFAKQLKRMKELGIFFVIASGNEYKAMYSKFQPFSDDLYFVCDNGCTIAKGKEMLAMKTIDNETANQIAWACDRQEDLVSIVSCEKHCFMPWKFKDYKSHFENYFFAIEFLDSLFDLPEKVLKFSVVDPDCKIDRFVDALQRDLPEGFVALTAGNECIDIMPKLVSKGTGLEELMEMHGIQPEESMAFGDQMNDLSMFSLVKHSYAMANAIAAVKEAAEEIAPSNHDEGVLEIIDRWLI